MQVKPLFIQCIIIVLNDITSKSREQRLITKEHIATHVNLILLFKPALYSSTLVYLKVVLCRNSYCSTIGQSSFISFATRTTRPLLKLKSFLLLVMYNRLTLLPAYATIVVIINIMRNSTSIAYATIVVISTRNQTNCHAFNPIRLIIKVFIYYYSPLNSVQNGRIGKNLR